MMAAETRRRWYCWCAVLFALVQLSGCAQLLGGKTEIRQKRRFTLVAGPILQGPEVSLRPYPVTVQLRTFDIAGHYNQLEIVSRSSPYELRRDPLHVWGLRPREMITQVVANYLRSSQLFGRLVTERDLLDVSPDYVISGSIRALERFDSGDRWFARLQLSMQVVRRDDGQVVWRGEITSADEVEVYDSDMHYTVQAVSEILRRRMEAFIRQLDTLFARMDSVPEALDATAASSDSSDGTAPVAVGQDTATVAIPDYYEIMPGKLAP
jgi:hypothetical protein